MPFKPFVKGGGKAPAKGAPAKGKGAEKVSKGKGKAASKGNPFAKGKKKAAK